VYDVRLITVPDGGPANDVATLELPLRLTGSA
jgi:hypothetical protein